MNRCSILFSAIVHLLAIVLAWNVSKQHGEISASSAFKAEVVLRVRQAVLNEEPLRPRRASRAAISKPIQKNKIAVAKTDAKDSGALAMEKGGTDYGLKALVRERPFLQNGEQLKAAYPDKARLLKIEGRVRLMLEISKLGKVISAKVISGPAFGLREAAMALTPQMVFLPATDLSGEPLATLIEHDVIFRLSEH